MINWIRILCLTVFLSATCFLAAGKERPSVSVTLDRFNEALSLFNEHEYDKAETVFKQVVRDSFKIEELTETRLKSIQYLGFISRERHDYVQSNRWFRAAAVVLSDYGTDEQKSRWKKLISNEIETNRTVIDYDRRHKEAQDLQRKKQNAILGALLFLAALVIVTVGVMFTHLRRVYRQLAAKNAALATSSADPANIHDREFYPLRKKISDYIVESKAYLNPDLCLDDVCKAIGSNRTYVSSELNGMADNFNAYVNKYRVREAIRLLLEEPDMKIDEVWEQSGFNSKNTFYSAFKEITGMTPSLFRKVNKEASA